MTRKSFKGNPALQFISGARAAEERSDATPRKEPTREQPKTEKKTRRVFLLMQPSLYDAISQESTRCGQSVNEWIHAQLRKSIEERRHGQ